MKTKYKLTKAEYDSTSGISTVTIHTDKGDFCGVARINPAQDLPKSSYLGCRLAECRAFIKYLKVLKYEVDAKINALELLNKSYSCYKEYSTVPRLNNRLHGFLKEYKQEKILINTAIETTQNNIQEAIKDYKHFQEVINGRKNRKHNQSSTMQTSETEKEDINI